MSSVDTQMCDTGEGNRNITFLFPRVSSIRVKETQSSSKRILKSDVIAKQFGIYQ